MPPLRDEEVIFSAIKKKYAKFTALRTIISRIGRINAVSSSACPESLRARFRILMITTSIDRRSQPFRLRLRFLQILNLRFVCFKLFLCRFLIGQVELIQQAMEVTPADA